MRPRGGSWGFPPGRSAPRSRYTATASRSCASRSRKRRRRPMGSLPMSPGLCLGVYVADCCAVYLADPVKRAIGLLHSGKKGTELAIAAHAIETMVHRVRQQPRRLGRAIEPLHPPAAIRGGFRGGNHPAIAERRRGPRIATAAPTPPPTSTAITPTAWKKAAPGGCSRC